MATPTKTRKASAPRKARARTEITAPKPVDVDEVVIEDDDGVDAPSPMFQPLPAVREEEPEPAFEHPYGDKPVYIFHPVNGAAPIIFPAINTVNVSAKFMWKIYDLNELFQSFEWMKLAEVPRDIQERVLDLPMADRSKFWAGWFNNVTGPLDVDPMGPPGE